MPNVSNVLIILGHRYTTSNPIRHCKTVDENDHAVAGILEPPIADLMLRLIRVRMHMQHKGLCSRRFLVFDHVSFDQASAIACHCRTS